MNTSNSLKRTLGMQEAVTITVGTVIGVGLFTIGSQIVGNMGSMVVLATFIAMLISIYPAWLYGEMGAALPFAGGTYKYAQLGLNHCAGVLAGWNFIASLVAVTSGEALAFAFYFKTLFRAMGIELPLDDAVLAMIPIAVFIGTNIYGTKFTGRLQNAFIYFFWSIAFIWALTMLPNIHMPHYVVLPAGLSDMSSWSFIGMVALIWWCFAGFETCCALGEEIRFPEINIPRALKLAPFIVFIVNAIFQWFLVGITPTDALPALASADAPYAEAMEAAGILGLPLIMLALGISVGGDFSTLNSSIAVPPRYLYAMAREGSMPKIFSKLHPKYGTPWVAILFLGILSLILVKYPITFVASVSLFADLFYYIIGIAAAWGLRHRLPDLKRPFKAPMVEIGVPVSIIIYLIMMTQLDQDAIVSGIIWCVAGVVVYWFCRRQNEGIEEVQLETLIADTPEPTSEEQLAMDKDYRFWKRVTATFFILSLLIYAVPVFF